VSDYETIQRRRNIEVGIFVLIALISIVWLIFKFGDLPVTVSELKSYKVYVRFASASGVQENTPVRFCGYQIGRVVTVQRPDIREDLKTGKFYHQAEVILNIDSRYDNIPADVEVKLMTRGLGSSYIEFKTKPFDVEEPLGEFLKNGSLLQGETGISSEFFPEESQKKLDELVDNLRTLITNANDIIGDQANKEHLRTTLTNLSVASGDASAAIKEFQNLASTANEAIKTTDVRMEKLVVSAIDTSEQLSKSMAELRLILEKVNAGDGTAGRLVNDARLYEGLLESSQQIEMLLMDIRAFVEQARKAGVPIKIK
jgi:phospholipid/cholesterol/gamma-HCH transport system substrate-binding protein